MANFVNAERDADDLAKLVNEDVEVTTRYGDNPKKSYQRVINEIQDSADNKINSLAYNFNLTPAFDFADGFTIETRNQAGKDADGNYWIYNGALPFVVTAGTIPSSPDYKKVTFSEAQNVTLSTGQSVQGFIDSFALKILQSPTDGGLTEIQTRTVDAGEVYEVRKTSDNSLATIYSDAAGTTEIVQNGTDNKSGSDGVVEFFIADGDYYVEVGGVSREFYTSRSNYTFSSDSFGSAIDNMIAGRINGTIIVEHKLGNIYYAGNNTYTVFADSLVSDYEETLIGVGVARQTGGTISESKAITVGPTGDFETLNSAVSFASLLPPSGSLKEFSATVTIMIESSFIMSEQILVLYKNLGWISISTNNVNIPVVQSSLNIPISSADYPLFGAAFGGVLPFIFDSEFTFDGSGSSDSINDARHGIYVRQFAKARIQKLTINNAGGSGAYAEYQGRIEGRGCNFPNAGLYGIGARHMSYITARDLNTENSTWDLSGAAVSAVYASNRSSIYARYIDAKNAGETSVSVRSGSEIASNEIDISGGAIGVTVAEASSFSVVGEIVADSITNRVFNVYGAGTSLSAGSVTGVGVTSTQAIYVTDGGSLSILESCYMPSVPNDCIVGLRGATVTINGLEAEGAGRYGVNADNSNINIPSAKLKDAGSSAIVADNMSKINAPDTDGSGSVSASGVRAFFSTVNVQGGNFQRGASPASTDIRVTNGGTIYANGTTGGTYTAQNAITSDGIIYK